MNKKTKIAVLIGAIAAVVSAVILVVVFWDKLLNLCPCKKKAGEEYLEEEPEEDTLAYNEEELQDFADLEPTAE